MTIERQGQSKPLQNVIVSCRRQAYIDPAHRCPGWKYTVRLKHDSQPACNNSIYIFTMSTPSAAQTSRSSPYPIPLRTISIFRQAAANTKSEYSHAVARLILWQSRCALQNSVLNCAQNRLSDLLYTYIRQKTSFSLRHKSQSTKGASRLSFCVLSAR